MPAEHFPMLLLFLQYLTKLKYSLLLRPLLSERSGRAGMRSLFAAATTVLTRLNNQAAAVGGWPLSARCTQAAESLSELQGCIQLGDQEQGTGFIQAGRQ